MIRQSDEEIARTIMAIIAHDCGANSRTEQKANSDNQPSRHVQNIAEKAGRFFDQHPHLLIVDVLEEIAIGEEEERQKKYGNLRGFSALNEALNEYYNQI